MNIFLNGTPTNTPDNSLQNLIKSQRFTEPFAVAVNTCFVPKSHYETTTLNENDCVEIVSPVAGG